MFAPQAGFSLCSDMIALDNSLIPEEVVFNLKKFYNVLLKN